MAWLIVMAGVVAVLPAAVAALSMRQRLYLRWVSSWVQQYPNVVSAAEPQPERLLTEPLPGGVVGECASQFSGDGNVALVESGVRLTQWSGHEHTAWGAFWPDLTGYVVLRDLGVVRIDVSGNAHVNVETGSRAVQDQWASVLRTNGVPLRNS